jgi:ribose transport system ATP-binding protein
VRRTLLTCEGVTKAYGGIPALREVDFDVQAGEIHALVGENGAGKSTLIKILTGAVVPDAGEITLDGLMLSPGNPPATRALGVSCVYQELALVPALSVTDNILLGREGRRLLLDRRQRRRATLAALDELGLAIDPDTPVEALSVAHQQLVEIARALAGEARILILDEPTASLADRDIERLFTILDRLRARGLGIVYISHRLDEIFRLADRITVLRDGSVVARRNRGELSKGDLIRQMVGRDLSEEFPLRNATPGAAVLEIEHLSAPPRFRQATLAVRAGEIVGMAGLVGAGRTSVALAAIGALPSSGVIRLHGRNVRFTSPSAAIRAGMAYVTEDRKAHGLFPLLGTGANITITFLRAFARAGLLSRSRERLAAEAAAHDYNVRASGLAQPAATLSGGNQQKLLLARCLLRPRAVIILDEPTRGVDVGARAEIYRIVNRLTEDGLGVLMISSDLTEILGMSDRVVVMREGTTTGELSRADATAERVMALAAGAAA